MRRILGKGSSGEKTRDEGEKGNEWFSFSSMTAPARELSADPTPSQRASSYSHATDLHPERMSLLGPSALK